MSIINWWSVLHHSQWNLLNSPLRPPSAEYIPLQPRNMLLTSSNPVLCCLAAPDFWEVFINGDLRGRCTVPKGWCWVHGSESCTFEDSVGLCKYISSFLGKQIWVSGCATGWVVYANLYMHLLSHWYRQCKSRQASQEVFRPCRRCRAAVEPSLAVEVSLPFCNFLGMSEQGQVQTIGILETADL